MRVINDIVNVNGTIQNKSIVPLKKPKDPRADEGPASVVRHWIFRRLFMLHRISGDLTTLAGHFVLIQQVNCQNRMGAGLALALMRQWPRIANDYHGYCAGHTPKELFGHVQTSTLGDAQFVCNVFGQLNYGPRGHFTDEARLLAACNHIIHHAGQARLPVFVPANLGSGLAGGNAEQIQAGLAQAAQRWSADVYLVDFVPNLFIAPRAYRA